MAKALKLSLALAAMLAMVSPAAAATIITSFDTTPLAPSVQLVPTSFTGLAPDVNVTTSIAGIRRSPWEFTPACAEICAYNSVRAGSTATYDFATNQASLNMMWGSPDSPPPVGYNVLEFYDNGILQGSFDGSLISGLLTAFGVAPNNVAARGFLRVTFTGVFDRVVFNASQYAFEHVFNVRGSATPEVPLPAGLVLLLTGLGGLGFLGRSRKRLA